LKDEEANRDLVHQVKEELDTQIESQALEGEKYENIVNQT